MDGVLLLVTSSGLVVDKRLVNLVVVVAVAVAVLARGNKNPCDEWKHDKTKRTQPTITKRQLMMDLSLSRSYQSSLIEKE
jgi:hypothetical protein